MPRPVHPDALTPLAEWYAHLRKANYTCFADVRADYRSADWVKGFIVFNIGGNKYRLIVSANFPGRRVFVKHVLTHQEYDLWEPL